MKNNPSAYNPAPLDPASISRFKKERFLLQMSEDEFRDRVVRPVLLKKGFTDGQDTCGTTEEGKDAIFTASNLLGFSEVYVIQTKKGKINLSSKGKDNLITAITQLNTALATKVIVGTNKERVFPNYAILCSSGQINKAAKDHIIEQTKTRQLIFMDSDDLITMIDEVFPELWYGIDANKFPYLRNLKDHLLRASDTISLAELDIDAGSAAPITDEMYVPLYVHRIRAKTVKKNRKVQTEPELEQFHAHALLQRPEHLIHMVGEAGAGKTTTLRRFAYMVAEKALSESDNHIIPIILKCTDLIRSSARLVDDIANATMQFSGGRSCFSDTDLQNGTLLILIDSLDEIPADERPKILTNIIDFSRSYPKCRIIITSRDYSSILELPELANFQRFTLTPIDLRQAEKILTRLKHGKALPVHAANEMLRQLHDVHGMDLSPLLVTVFIAASDFSRHDIPANITELFKKFTEMMLGRWDQRKGLSQQYQAQVKDFLLKRLGFHMHSNHLTSISLSECKTLFENNLKETGHQADLDILFDETIYRSSIFRIEGQNISFRHALLQEFFAGRGVPSTTFFQSVITDDWWKHAIIFHFGDKPEAHGELTSLILNLASYEGVDLYRAAVAIGLAVQACYLSKVTDKIKSINWVVQSLIKAKPGFVQAIQQEAPELEFTAMLQYYYFGRDAVACKAIEDAASSIIEANLPQVGSSAEKDLEVFWYIVSLIQSGNFKRAQVFIKSFKPTDTKLLLSLHLGCFMIAHLKITPEEHKKIAEEICEFVQPKIAFLREQLLEEMKGMLLDVRKGKITLISSEEQAEGTEQNLQINKQKSTKQCSHGQHA
jgi:hypothetical protein